MQGHSQASTQSQDQRQPLSGDMATGGFEAPPEQPQRVPSPAGVLPDEPGAVFMLDPASLPRMGGSRSCSDGCTRSQSAAVLSACG